LDRIRAAPSEVVFIDDKEENVRGAKESGILLALRFRSTEALRRDIAALTY
jgi:FMN phosphatase YigB (HAD superfamily)